MSAARHRSLHMTIALVMAFVLTPILSHVAYARGAPETLPNSPQSICTASCNPGGYPFYGANQSWMQTAVDSNHAHWPQAHDNWCGVADITAINYYAWKKYNGSTPPNYTTQSSVASMLNSNAAISPWGLALSHGTSSPAFKADIAADFGTDPRAMAWGAWNVTPNGYYFHNYNYSQQDNSTATSATYQVALDFGPAHGVNDPVIVTIWGGKHALIEDGVYASSDPSAGGETIGSVHLWDPAYNGAGTGYIGGRSGAVSLYDWVNDTSLGNSGYWFWHTPYQTDYFNNPGDPDPWTSGGGTGATQNYYNVTAYDSSATLVWHWKNAWVTIEQDYVYTCNASPNYALNRYGNLDLHNGSVACG